MMMIITTTIVIIIVCGLAVYAFVFATERLLVRVLYSGTYPHVEWTLDQNL